MTTLPIGKGAKIPLDIGGISEVRLEEFLGEGGSGSVWRVRDTQTGQQYVLKIITNLPPTTVNFERVRMEAEVKIPSPYISKSIGLKEWELGIFLILFEYYPGASLDKLLPQKRLNSELKRQIFDQILVGVRDAHKYNIIHRDLKPHNILVSEDYQVKLLDFGISKFKASNKTKPGQIMGTFPYMAPELFWTGARVADARSDIFSLGQILYELATGQHYWDYRQWQMRDFFRYINQTPTPTVVIDVPDFSCDFYDNADKVIVNATQVEPVRRYQSVNEMMAELGCAYAQISPQPNTDIDCRTPMLIVETGDNRGERAIIDIPDGGRIIIGSGSQAEIILPYKTISRQHLELSRTGAGYFVRDIRSTNGTLIRGIALSPDDPPFEIQPDDLIRLGDIFLRFTFLKS